ncbi:MAG: dockerin type I repeat-containing protein [Oscillibacter sp.]|nr:dockerin type I repeat-containing protein [Oscillibacter sp.]
MKRLMKPLLLASILMALLTVTALAAGDSGINTAEATLDGVTVSPQKADKSAPDAATEDVAYPGAVRLAVSYNAAEDGKEYVVIATKGETAAPTKDDIVYIDQATASGSIVSFNVYPSELKKDTTYCIYLVSNGTLEYTKAATYTYYQAYTLGDVNDSGKADAIDAMYVLQYDVGLATDYDALIPLAGDVNASGKADAIDAMYILQYDVGLITEWPNAT